MALIAAILAAYAAPLAALIRAMGYDTPLAYLALVPPIAIALGIWRYYRIGSRPAAPAPRDAIVGSILLALAAFVGYGLPALLDPSRWSQPINLAAFPLFAADAHLDLLSLPVFATGMLVLLYGVPALRWAWPALAYGSLIWPVPYMFLLGHLLPSVSDATVWATSRLTAVLPLGATVDPQDGTLFTIATAHGPQVVSVGTACSGFNSFVAWLLIGVALTIVVCERRGDRSRRRMPWRLFLWLGVGAIGTFLSNLLRIALLFALVHHSGFDAIFNWSHALLGNGLFDLTVLAMLCLLPRFGLVLPQPTAATRPRPAPTPVALDPFQALLLAATTLALGAGMLLGVEILRLAAILLGVYLLFCLYLLALFARSCGVNRRMPPLRVSVVALGAVIAVAGVVLLFRHLKQDRIEQLPSIGWRIDQGQQALITGPLRYILAIVCAVGAFAAGRSAILSRRRRVTPNHAMIRRRLPQWSWSALAAGAMIAGTVVLSISTVTVASFKGSVAASGTAMSEADFDVSLPHLLGTEPAFVEAFDWAKQSLGKTATYTRYQYDRAGGPPLWVDVLTAEDADALAYHNVRSCYAFHGFIERETLPVEIGSGVGTARIVNYSKPDVREMWSALYWEQKILRGTRTFHQRIVLLSYLNVSTDEASGVAFSSSNALMQADAAQLVDRLATYSAT